MSKLSAIKRKARQRNSGGVYPEPMSVALTLLTALHRLKPRIQPTASKKISSYDRQLFYFVYLWLTGELADCRTTDDIPLIDILTGSKPCRANALRRVRMNNISWVEYALSHDTHHGIKWQWQPLPNGLNAYFSHALTQSTEHWELSIQEKDAFIDWLTTKWRTPTSLLGRYRMRRDGLFGYFKTLANLDSGLSTLSKRALLGEEGLHHHSASAYQSQDSEQLRYEIFHAQTRYLDRLRHVLMDPKLEPMLNVPLPITANERSLLHKNDPLPEHLLVAGRIAAFHLDLTKATKTYIKTPALAIGSQRMLEVDKVRNFFRHLHQQALKVTQPQYTPTTLRELANFRASELALLFIVLTGVRPTHSITLEQACCFNFQYAIVSDKGRWRSVTLPEYLQQALLRFEKLKCQLNQFFPKYTPSSLLWFQVNEQGEPLPLTAKTLRHFMMVHWSQCYPHDRVVPYQLRHFFAQHARAALDPVLSTQDVDQLMGHSSFGEHLGSDTHFPASQRKLTKHLNGISDFLQLAPIMED
ncbi:site-specific integrase [Shewanella canadensis]|uniref:Site-specific integrase n=1 Tax=Shewanella canadensis TaxID=271096 RepID=A0A3S0IMR2_9GAMM|nr:site-specific integrase [Shewanella canadensis]RTR35897.1 site-specific integrase [Shewanella canadensis]